MLTVCILALFFGLLGFGFGLTAFIKVLASEKATHTVYTSPAHPEPAPSLSEMAARSFAGEDNDGSFDIPIENLEDYLLGRQ